jgi:hypothetical protein
MAAPQILMQDIPISNLSLETEYSEYVGASNSSKKIQEYFKTATFKIHLSMIISLDNLQALQLIKNC